MYVPKKRDRRYTNEAWLRRQVLVLRKTPKQIAEETGAGLITVYRYLEKFGLR